METIPPKNPRNSIKVKKSQFETKEEAIKFAKASKYHTQIYKKEFLKHTKKS